MGLYLGTTGSSTEAFGARRSWVILRQADCTLWAEQEAGEGKLGGVFEAGAETMVPL